MRLSPVGQEEAIAAAVRREQVIAAAVRQEQVIVPVGRERTIAAAVRQEQAIAAVRQGPNLPRGDSRKSLPGRSIRTPRTACAR